MSKGQHPINTEVTVGLVTVRISGESIHSNKDAQRCAELLADALGAVRYKGDFKVIASMQRLKGSSKLQGLSVKGLSNNAILLGYQPYGNNGRATYTLQFPTVESAQRCFPLLKKFLGTAYNGGQKNKLPPKPITAYIAPSDEDYSQDTDSGVVAKMEKPASAPDIFYIDDPEWVTTLVEDLWFKAEEQRGQYILKLQVLNMIFERTHFETHAETNPIFETLKARGYLVPVQGQSELFTVLESPAILADEPKKPRSAKKRRKHSAAPKRKYINDEAWVTSFMEGLQALVADNNGLITKTELNRFIKERTNQVTIGGVVLRICKDLEVRGFIMGAGEKLYRVVYTPKAETAKKAVETIQHERAETRKTFDGFAMFKPPLFAEGMFENKQLLDQFLTRVHEGMKLSAELRTFILGWYPDQKQRSIYHLFDFLVGKGYLTRPKLGHYELGPTGRERLGLVVGDLNDSAPPEPEAKASVPVPSEAPATTAVSVPASSDVQRATALALQKATKAKAAADASEEIEAGLRTRLDTLKAQLAAGPTPEMVDVAVTSKLVEMANNL